jgi:DNA-binding NtrC family response regulator
VSAADAGRALALLVDDEADFRDTLAELVRREGFETACVPSLAEARRALAERHPDLVLVDLSLPDGCGLDLLGDPELGDRAEIVVITGHGTVDSAVQAMLDGCLDYLTKPVDRARLRSVPTNVGRTIALKTEVGGLRSELRTLGRFGPMVGGSPGMQRTYDLIARVAPTDVTVLVLGESGTGKELVARAIHDLSRRRAHPCLPVNCGAISRELIESELFGHERGSFTGASAQHAGYFERARGGTLFLDEITEMPVELQVKLLRVLETCEITRVGGGTQLPVNVRVVAATNRDPEQAVSEGRLREDLYHRLNVFPMEIPPLRERGDDVELLAQHFLGELNREHDTSKRWAPEALEALRRASWPGNVRELRNAVQRAYILANAEIGPDALPGLGGGAVPCGPTLRVPIGTPVAEVERQLILGTLQQTGGDKRRAASVLGISLRTLYNRLKRYETPAVG